MKIYMKPIKMVFYSEEDGIITPLKFQMKNPEKENVTVKVDNIVLRTEERLAGNRMLIYRCQSIINNTLVVYELKYEISTCKWFLFKM